MLSNQYDARSYPRVDAADDVSCRPDFAVLIYPGGLTERDKPATLNPGVTPVAGKTPPTFIAMTEDDRVGDAVAYYLGLEAANVPVEMHLYPKGGHGYGLRRTELLVTTWPDRVHEWMKSSGWLASPKR